MNVVTWSGENTEEVMATIGIGRINEKNGDKISVVTNGGPVLVLPGDTLVARQGDIEVYSCLIFHPVFRKLRI